MRALLPCWRVASPLLRVRHRVIRSASLPLCWLTSQEHSRVPASETQRSARFDSSHTYISRFVRGFGSTSRQHQLQCSAVTQLMGVLDWKGDVYDGVIVDAGKLPEDPQLFDEMLRTSLQEWKTAQRKGIWLQLPITHSQLVSIATQHGFYFHHAERNYVMMAQWLPAGLEDKLPSNASHQVGVGAFVFDKERQSVLMVQERNGPLRGTGVWKMPTGLVTAREDISDAAMREVLEETGVQTRFLSVLALRQAHTALWDKSDMFFVVALQPETRDIKIQEDELVGAEWQSLEQFESNPFPQKHPLLAKIMERCIAYAKGEYAGLVADKLPSRFNSESTREDLLVYGTGLPSPQSDL